MTNDGKYQVMPPLSADEEAQLRDEIAVRGVLVPVVRDQHGNILDGHHRSRIAEELGVEYRVDVVQVTDEQHARSLARTYNLARRHLTREQKRQLIADEITDNPDRSDREIARLMGCDHKTVGSVRRELSGEVPQPSGDRTPEQVEQAKAELAGLESVIRAALRGLDQSIQEMLQRGIAPYQVAGILAAAWSGYLRGNPDPDEEFLALMRRTFYDDRVSAVLAWPGGFYAEGLADARSAD